MASAAPAMASTTATSFARLSVVIAFA